MSKNYMNFNRKILPVIKPPPKINEFYFTNQKSNAIQ